MHIVALFMSEIVTIGKTFALVPLAADGTF